MLTVDCAALSSDGLDIKDYPVRTAAVTSSTGLASLISELDVLLVQGHELGAFVRGEAVVALAGIRLGLPDPAAQGLRVHTELAGQALDLRLRVGGPHRTAQIRSDVGRAGNKRLAVEFARYTTPGVPYIYHCHVLRHEDMGMMGQFLVVSPGSEEGTSRSIDMTGHSH